MKLKQAEAILLSVQDLQEADRVVEFLTREDGRHRGVARGAKRRYSRFAGELQPLAKARIGWVEKEGRDLVRINSVELLRPAKSLASDLEGILLGASLAEQMAVFAQENEPSEVAFRLLDTTVEALEGGADRRLATAYYESWLLRLAGIFPPPIECPQCGRDLEGGAALPASGETLLCRTCAGPGALRVGPAAIRFWRRIGRENLAAMAASPPSAEILVEVGEVVGRVRRHFLQHEIRSLTVMDRTLGGLPGGV
ncbi:MAG: DNA repair protein RecO [Thermoanaerobaculia bacterium]